MKSQIIPSKSLSVQSISNLNHITQQRLAKSHHWAKYCVISDGDMLYALADELAEANACLSKLSQIQGCSAVGLDSMPSNRHQWNPSNP